MIMIAQEMFEKLQYIKTLHDDKEIVYVMYNDYCKVAEIGFDLINQTFDCNCYDEVMDVNMKTLKAINQQCKELGWL